MGLIERITKASSKEEYLNAILLAADDAEITGHEYHALKKTADRLKLSAKQRSDMHLRALHQICGQTIADRVIETSELKRIEAVMSAFGLTWDDVPGYAAEIDDIVFFQAVSAGNLPVVPRQQVHLLLEPDEVCHYQIPGWIIEDRVVGRRTIGGSHGTSLRIAQGVRIRVGGVRGTSYPVVEPRVVSEGVLSVTNKHISYLADRKGFHFPWKRIIGVDPFTDALILYVKNRQTAPIVQFAEGEGARLQPLIAYLVNQ